MKKLLVVLPVLLALSAATVKPTISFRSQSDSLPAGTRINFEIAVPGDPTPTKFSYTVPAPSGKPNPAPVVVPDNKGLSVVQVIASQSSRVGEPFSFIIPAGTFSGNVTGVDVSDLPAGLRYDSRTRTISGTPTRADKRTITVTASDGSRIVQTGFVLSFAANTPAVDVPTTDLPVVTDPVKTESVAQSTQTYALDGKSVYNTAQFGTGKYYAPNYFCSIDFNPNRDNVETRRAQGITMFTPWVLPDGQFDNLPKSQKLFYLFESSLHGVYEGAKYYESPIEELEAQYFRSVPGGGAIGIPNQETSTEWNQWRYVQQTGHGYDSWDVAKNRSIKCELDGQIRTLDQLYNSGLWDAEAHVRKANRDALLAATILARNDGFAYGSSMGQGEPRTNSIQDRSLFVSGSPNYTHVGGDNQGNVTINGRRYTGLSKNVFGYETAMLDYYYYFNANLSSADYTDIFIDKRLSTQNLPYIWSKLAPYHISASEKGHWQANRAKMNLPGQKLRGTIRMQEPFYEGDFYTEGYVARSAFMPFAEIQNVSFGSWSNTPKVWLPPYMTHGAYTMHRFLEGDTPNSGYHLFNAPSFVQLPVTHPLYAHHLSTITAILQARDGLQFLESWYPGSTLVEDPEVQINQAGEYQSYSGATAFAFGPDGSRGTQLPSYALRYEKESGSTRVVIVGGVFQDYAATHSDNIRITLPGQTKPTVFTVTTTGPSVQVFDFRVEDGKEAIPYSATSTTNAPAGYAGKFN